MGEAERVSADLSVEEELYEEESVDLFCNRKRQSLLAEGTRRATLGLPDNGAGMTKDYYNIDRPMSVTSLVDLIVLRRAGSESRPRRRSTQLSGELEERIKKTLAWKEVEDELNKEDVMVNFRKKMRELRKEARQSIPKEIKIERKINEERRIQLRTSLLEPNNQRRSTAESIKEAIQEFRMKQPAIIEEPQVLKDYEEDKEVSDIIQKTRELLEQMGYIKMKESEIGDDPFNPNRNETNEMRGASSDDSETGLSRKRKKGSLNGSEKSISANTGSKIKPGTGSLNKAVQEPSGSRASKRSSTQTRAGRTPVSSAAGPSRKSDVRPPPVRPHAHGQSFTQAKKDLVGPNKIYSQKT